MMTVFETLAKAAPGRRTPRRRPAQRDLIVLCVFIICVAQQLNAQTVDSKPAERHAYKIELKIDFDKLTYFGSERVRWINRGEKPTSLIYFHLYPNLRTGEQPAPVNGAAPDADEPRLDIVDVRTASDNTPLLTSLDDQGTTLRVNLREQVA